MTEGQAPHPPSLSVDGVSVRFGGLKALNSVDLEVHASARHGILGPNGAGKTTLFNVVTGLLSPSEGRIFIEGIDVTHWPPHRRVGLGLARTFQITTLLPELTALENVLMGVLVRVGRHRNIWRAAREDREALHLAEALLQQLGLGPMADTSVRDLGYGEQRQLEIAVALGPGPRILLLDEPTAGLSTAETQAVKDLIGELPEDLTIVVIEHDLEVIFDIAEHVTVLHYGERIADGPAEAVRQDPIVKEVYLGGG